MTYACIKALLAIEKLRNEALSLYVCVHFYCITLSRQGDSLQLLVDEGDRRYLQNDGDATSSVKLPFASTLGTLPNKIVFPKQKNEQVRMGCKLYIYEV